MYKVARFGEKTQLKVSQGVVTKWKSTGATGEITFLESYSPTPTDSNPFTRSSEE